MGTTGRSATGRAVVAGAIWAVVAVPASCLWSCGPEPGSGAERAADLPPADVILIVVDTLRADPLGCYGSADELTPNIDALAARGTRFERALSVSSWTVPAMASLVTGRHPEEHGLEEGSVRRNETTVLGGLHASLPTLAERFRDAGYATIGVTTNAHLCERLGFARGFDRFELLPWARGQQVAAWLEAEPLIRDRSRPRFLLIHLFDPHHPYRPHEPPFLRLVARNWTPRTTDERPGALAWSYTGRSTRDLDALDELRADGRALPVIRAAYESEVAYTDQVIGRILSTLQIDDRSLVVVTADHGEEFREHGRLGHRQSLYAELVRVPLVIAWPAVLPAGTVVTKPVSTLDIYPTLLALAGLPLPDGVAGHSLLGPAGLSSGPNRAIHSTVIHEGRRLRSVALGRIRLIVDERSERVELFDENMDPWNRTDVRTYREADALRLLAGLEDLRRTARPVTPPEHRIDEETLEQLRQLGYLASESEPPGR